MMIMPTVFPYDVTSNAFQLDISKNIITLSDNVQIQTDSYHFVSDKAVMGLYDNKIRIEDHFKIKYMDQIINGESMELDNNNNVLTADYVELYFYKYLLEGRKVNARVNQVSMRDVMITSCRGDNKIMYLKSENVNMYPAYGFLVALNSVLYLYDVPVLYFPAYFMGDRRYSAFANNSLIPEIGSNKVEGTYIKENLPYYMDPKNNGSIQIGYLSNYGLKAGFQHYSMLFDGQHKSTFGLYYTSKYWQGNLKYSVALFKEEVKEKYFLSFLFNNEAISKQVSNIYLSYFLKYNELINDQIVSIQPGYEFLTHLNLDDKHEVNLSLEFSDIEENHQTKNNRISYRADIQTNLKYGDISVTNIAGYFRHIYSSNKQFESIQDNIEVLIPISIANLSFDYEHIFNFFGSSPFYFDMYQIDSFDKIGMGINFKMGVFDLGYKLRKRLSQDYYYFRKYEISIPYEYCMDFIIYWEDVKKEFGISIRI